MLRIAALYRETVIGNISLNQLGTSDPPPMVRIALDGFLAFVETTIEAAVRDEVPREQVIELVGGTLMATVNAAVGAENQGATASARPNG
jgi:hypothetical protein